MTFFSLVSCFIWSRTLNFIAKFLVKDSAPYNPALKISLAIEVVSTLSFAYLFEIIPPLYQPSLALFFSALFVTMHTDAQTMLISRFTTVYLVPIGWFAAYAGFLPISSFQSIAGSLLGLLFLWIVARVSFYFMKVEGLGQGDIDMMAMVGAFLGPIGCWMTVMAGSLIGSVVGIVYIFATGQDRKLKLPFGVFLALGSVLFVLFKPQFSQFWFA